MFMYCHQTTAQSHYTKVANSCFENVTNLRYLGKTATNQNSIEEEIISKLNYGNACYYVAQTFSLRVYHIKT
jgi:ERCC4-related helicase